MYSRPAYLLAFINGKIGSEYTSTLIFLKIRNLCSTIDENHIVFHSKFKCQELSALPFVVFSMEKFPQQAKKVKAERSSFFFFFFTHINIEPVFETSNL